MQHLFLKLVCGTLLFVFLFLFLISPWAFKSSRPLGCVFSEKVVGIRRFSFALRLQRVA